MNHFLKVLLLLCFISISQITFAQTNKQKAEEKTKQGIELVDQKKYNEGLKLYQEALELDPGNSTVIYEIGYTYYLQEKYKKAAEQFEKIIDSPEAVDGIYQMLGNAYDMAGDSKKALGAYDKGLKKFPKSGRLYLEKGNVFWNQKKYEEALPFYEKGIQAEPSYPSNYYRAAIIYCKSDEEVWGMIYGEIFINLEPNSKRTETISKLLFDTYKSEIKFTNDTTYSVSFSKGVIMADDLAKMKMPYGVMIYEPALALAIAGEKNINLNSLDRIRTAFVKSYFEHGDNVEYPNVLFDYQKKILDAGHFEAYNHFLLQMGYFEGFEDWKRDNKEKWDAFVTWYVQNPLKLDERNRFYKGQY